MLPLTPRYISLRCAIGHGSKRTVIAGTSRRIVTIMQRGGRQVRCTVTSQVKPSFVSAVSHSKCKRYYGIRAMQETMRSARTCEKVPERSVDRFLDADQASSFGCPPLSTVTNHPQALCHAAATEPPASASPPLCTLWILVVLAAPSLLTPHF